MQTSTVESSSLVGVFTTFKLGNKKNPIWQMLDGYSRWSLLKVSTAFARGIPEYRCFLATRFILKSVRIISQHPEAFYEEQKRLLTFEDGIQVVSEEVLEARQMRIAYFVCTLAFEQRALFKSAGPWNKALWELGFNRRLADFVLDVECMDAVKGNTSDNIFNRSKRSRCSWFLVYSDYSKMISERQFNQFTACIKNRRIVELLENEWNRCVDIKVQVASYKYFPFSCYSSNPRQPRAWKFSYSLGGGPLAIAPSLGGY